MERPFRLVEALFYVGLIIIGSGIYYYINGSQVAAKQLIYSGSGLFFISLLIGWLNPKDKDDE